MSGTRNRPTRRSPAAQTGRALIERLDATFDGVDMATVLGTLTTFITVLLADQAIPLDVFVDCLRESERSHREMQATGAPPDAKGETWLLISPDDRAAASDALLCLLHHCTIIDPGHSRARALLARLAAPAAVDHG